VTSHRFPVCCCLGVTELKNRVVFLGEKDFCHLAQTSPTLRFSVASEVSPVGKLWGAAAAGFPCNGHSVLCGAETTPAVAGPQLYLGESYGFTASLGGWKKIPLAQRHWRVMWL